MSAAVLVAESEPETRVFLERELPRDGFKIARLGGRCVWLPLFLIGRDRSQHRDPEKIGRTRVLELEAYSLA